MRWPNSSKTIQIPFVPLDCFDCFSFLRITPFNENLGRHNGITVYDNHTMISFQCSIAKVQLAKSWARHSRIVNLLANWGWQGNKHLAKLYIRTNRVQFRGQYSQRGSCDRTERGTEELTESLFKSGQASMTTERDRVTERKVDTYSTYLAHWTGSDMAMKQQFVKIVHIMNRLNKVRVLRKIWTFQMSHIENSIINWTVIHLIFLSL